jgi:two-component system OmpR family sensor kinase
VRFAITMGVGLTAAAVAAYRGTGRVMRHQLDHALAATAFFIGVEVETDSSPAGLAPEVLGNPAHYELDVNRYIALRTLDGAVLRAVPDEAASLPFDAEAAGGSLGGDPTLHDARWGERGVRILYYTDPARDPGGERVLQVGASLAPIEAVQRNLAFVLVVVVALGTAASFIGASRLVASAVQPVIDITQQATSIEARTLDQRIAVHAEVEEYRDLLQVLNRMLERLDEAFAMQRRFTADASHELRTPLTTLRGEIEVALRTQRTPDEYQRVLRSALDDIQAITELCEDLLFVSRAEARLATIRHAPTEFDVLVREAIVRASPAVEGKRLRLETALAADGGAAVDPILVGRMLDRLLDNAIKFSPEGGRLSVETAAAPDRVRLVIEDSGPGIAPEHSAHIFEPFYRADEARSRGTGTGLGLAVAAAVARVHGGAIRVANLPAGGTRFEAELPSGTLHS